MKTAINTIVSRTVKRLKPNASHIERDILSSLCYGCVDDDFLAQSDDVSEALLFCVLEGLVPGQDSQYGVECGPWLFCFLGRG